MRRHKHSLSHTKLASCDMGELVPVSLLEALPGDTIQQSTTCLVRMAAMLAPPMHPTHVGISHWFVPNRLIWEDFQDFITGGPDGNDTTVYPTMALPAQGVGTLADYLGVPTGVAIEVSALPMRAYNLIFNEYFRDQDLVDPVDIDISSGADAITVRALQRVAWEKDYYTTARPFEQKGPAITLPLGGRADVRTDAASLAEVGVESTVAGAQRRLDSVGAEVRLGTGTNPAADSLYADLSDATSVSINILREAFALQRFEEARARFGSRYTEYLRYLGVQSSDARLQRPEFLGGGRYPIQYSEVLATAQGASTNVGDLKGHGIGVARSNRYRRYIEEHGWILTLMHVRPKAIYVDGLQRHWNRRTKEDFFQPELAHIGQQELLNKEVYAAHTTPDGVFGYADRYAEYRENPSTVSGEFRTTLDFWHFGRAFSSDPALNSTFVECVPTENPFAVPSADVLQVQARHSIQARRLVSRSADSYIY